MNVRLRDEADADIPAIEALVARAFLDAPHAAHTEHYIVNALRRAGRLSISLVAEADGEIVGHVAVSPVSISDGTSGWYGLGPLSVEPARQRGGIGSLLMRAALSELRERGASGCVLLGEPRYYGRFGFQAEPSLRLAGLSDEHQAYFQALPFRGMPPGGTVAYHEAFGAQT